MRTETLERLKTIVNNGARKLTESDKAFIISICSKFGVPFRATNCRNCYIDVAVRFFQSFAKSKNELSINSDVDVYYNGMRVNCVVIDTPQKVEEVLKLGLPKKYVNFPNDANNQQD